MQCEYCNGEGWYVVRHRLDDDRAHLESEIEEAVGRGEILTPIYYKCTHCDAQYGSPDQMKAE